MRILFIGGPLDGKRCDVPDDALYWRHVETPAIDFGAVRSDPTDLPELIYHEYQRVRVSQKDSVFWFSDGGVVEPITALLRKYPDPDEKNRLFGKIRQLLDLLPEISKGIVPPSTTKLRSDLYRLINTP